MNDTCEIDDEVDDAGVIASGAYREAVGEWRAVGNVFVAIAAREDRPVLNARSAFTSLLVSGVSGARAHGGGQLSDDHEWWTNDATLRLLAAGIEEDRWGALEEALAESLRIFNETPDAEFPIDRALVVQGFERAVAVCRGLWKASLDWFGSVPTTPRLTALSDGSVDVFWRTDEVSLLINVVADDELGSFAGKRLGGESLTGVLDHRSSTLAHLAAWT
jgi:hypothetical protein